MGLSIAAGAVKMVALGTLVSGIGHEINNPNNFIMLNVPLIKGIWEDVLPLMEGGLRFSGVAARSIRVSTCSFRPGPKMNRSS